AEAELARREAERTALSELLASPESEGGQPVWDRVEVDSGYEAAVGAALGDDLQASTSEEAPVHWRELEAAQDGASLPDGVQSLADVVRAPSALKARLAQIGVVVPAGDGPRLQGLLRCGQRLVSKDGALWRWDGYTVAANAPTAAIRRLKARNRLTRLVDECVEAERRKQSAEKAADEASEARKSAEADWEKARAAADEAGDTLRTARDARASAETELATSRSRLAGLAETLARLERENSDATSAAATAREALDAIPPTSASDAEFEQLRTALAGLRESYEDRARRHDRIARDAADRSARLAELAREGESWKSRGGSARQRLAELAKRRTEAETERTELDAQPAALGERRQKLLGAIETQEGERRVVADALAAAEEQATATSKALKAAENAVAEAREAAARHEGIVAQASQAEEHAATQISERLGVSPEEAHTIAELPPQGEMLPDPEAVDIKLQRLIRERENIGAVNLRAEQEATELEEQIETMQNERSDLEAAIARLRQGISSLNREGRERMLAAFATIDEHFRRLFTQLFGGGKAHLELVDSDDPLE
ncbi:MAG: hypothetical protein MI755_19385, partial [Sphingomonadales bacterium]|nr:hypothetical protein [Sphingomonadales bacterium]